MGYWYHLNWRSRISTLESESQNVKKTKLTEAEPSTLGKYSYISNNVAIDSSASFDDAKLEVMTQRNQFAHSSSPWRCHSQGPYWNSGGGGYFLFLTMTGLLLTFTGEKAPKRMVYGNAVKNCSTSQYLPPDIHVGNIITFKII